ncbi:MAG: hypothetical protein ACPGVT_12000 [Maricaulaceae bacterium]
MIYFALALYLLGTADRYLEFKQASGPERSNSKTLALSAIWPIVTSFRIWRVAVRNH